MDRWDTRRRGYLERRGPAFGERLGQVGNVKLDHLVIPAAGLGTRMAAVGGGLPKELLELGGRPAVRYAVEEGIDAGVSNIAVVVSRRKESLRRYLERFAGEDPGFPSSTRLSFLIQEEPRGEADAIGLAEEFADGRPLAVIYPDNIYFPAPGALRLLRETYEERGEDIVGLASLPPSGSKGFGNSGHVELVPVEGPLFRITAIHPKGIGPFVARHAGELRAFGMSISGPHLFTFLRRARRQVRSGEFTDIYVRRLILEEKELLGRRLPGSLFDIGNPEGYRLCREFLAKGPLRQALS